MPAENPRTRDPSDTPAAEETLAAHARRALRTRVQARITAVLDAAIRFLQALRRKAGGAAPADDEEERPASRRERPRDRREDAAEPVAEPPKPRRWLRTTLIYLAVLLVGGGAGGAVAYVQFQKQLGEVRAHTQRLKAELAQKNRPGGDAGRAFAQEQARRALAEKKLAAALSEYAESTGHSYALLETLLAQQLAESQRMQTALAEANRSDADARKALEAEQARRIEAEQKLSSTLTEHEQYSREQDRLLSATERQLAKAERQLDRLHARSGTRSELPRESTRRSSYRSEPSVKTGNCTLGTASADALKGCIDEFNR